MSSSSRCKGRRLRRKRLGELKRHKRRPLLEATTSESAVFLAARGSCRDSVQVKKACFPRSETDGPHRFGTRTDGFLQPATTSSGRGGKSAGNRMSHTNPARFRTESVHQPGSHSSEANPSLADPGKAWWLLCQHSPIVSRDVNRILCPCTAAPRTSRTTLPWLWARYPINQ